MEHRYLAAVLTCDPSLAGREAVVIGGGEANTVLEVGEYVFRFPRNPAALARLRTEATLLQRLAPGAPVAIPAPTHLRVEGELGNVFMGYRLLPGEPLRRDTWLALSDPQRQRAATALGRFLAWLHGLGPAGAESGILSDIDLPCVAGPAAWRALQQLFEERLFPHMSASGREAVSGAYRRFVDEHQDQAAVQSLVHGDFGPSNILFDEARGEVSAIIDFGSSGLGDPAVDLAALIGPVSYGEDIVRLMAGAYPTAPDLVPRARYYASTFALQEALYAQDQGDAELFAQCMAAYR